MLRKLIRNATVLPFTQQADGSLDLSPQCVDILVEGDRISQVAPNLEIAADQVVDATNLLLIPGFVDAHTHTTVGILEKCGYEALPLEQWMLYLPPNEKLSSRVHYLCTMVAALEAVKNGTTTMQDDIYALPYTPPEMFGAVAQAYVDLGVRASLSLHAINKPLHETVPYLTDQLTDEQKQGFIAASSCTPTEWEAVFRQIYRDWHGQANRITTMLAPSASQRVTPELMHRIAALSEEFNVPIHTHLLETRMQAVTGLEFFGESVIAYAKRHGILTHRTTIAHGVWLSQADIDLVAEAGATVVHNVVSNHRLCSGIAPIRELIAGGVNVALGTDGMDSFNLFDVIKMAGLVHSTVDEKRESYPRAADILKWATYGGARSTLLQNQVGAIAPGMKADFVLYDLNSLSFTPRNQLPIHLVYSERGRSIRQVYVNGQLIVKDSQVLTVNEADLLAELSEHLKEYYAYREQWHQQSKALRPLMDAAFQKMLTQPLPIQRFNVAYGDQSHAPMRVSEEALQISS
ncbi:amidohydrolase family protein [Leptolyngbya sp. FACHB-671]|uniref:amidohydrolase family protein n=1 Tax=Leptolyngbya sp. FACHB-671 TaxID=2692812 RepID=UPI001686D214|nr:amidohydrolase family protein [Leptolyngbya sp. FACHB-671]MBD1868778.1 amidohydrolase family protein [Cyanobacteria bacterium FACHB-471]MBD2066090.1 amidohydrolase family protein [Leptolyngbya sp. FACHB-671]